MKIYCKCLNLCIECKGPDLQDVDVSNIDIPGKDLFSEGAITGELLGISKEQSMLVEAVSHGPWELTRCLNCHVYTHAIYRDREKGSTKSLIISKGLVTDPAVVAELRNSESFSPAFHILVTHHSEDEDYVLTKVSPAGKHQASGAALHQQLADYIQRESQMTEEKVRAFSDRQYALLEGLRSRAHQDHRALTRLLSETFPASTTLQESENVQPRITPQQRHPPTIPASKKSPTKMLNTTPNAGRTRSHGGLSVSLSLDSEGLFPLEGMEDHEQAGDGYPTDEEHSDTDDSGSHDEGIHIPRRVGSFVYAKSLPVDVPTFVQQRGASTGVAIGDEQRPEIRHHRATSPRQPVDIAASIKALAKSVHGDAVFGDLPRPRFSSQI